MSPTLIAPFSVENLLDRGPITYMDALLLQRRHVDEVRSGSGPSRLLLLEHTPTVTYGKTTRPENLLLTSTEFARRGIELIETDRGGDVTYHGPGQLVVYPILNLGPGNRDIHRYVRRLEETVIRTTSALGVDNAGRAAWHAGVWVGDGYLAALGVKVTRWVTYHGIALNVTDAVLDNFATIVPCGVEGKHIITLSALAQRKITVRDAADALTRAFSQVFAVDQPGDAI